MSRGGGSQDGDGTEPAELFLYIRCLFAFDGVGSGTCARARQGLPVIKTLWVNHHHRDLHRPNHDASTPHHRMLFHLHRIHSPEQRDLESLEGFGDAWRRTVSGSFEAVTRTGALSARDGADVLLAGP